MLIEQRPQALAQPIQAPLNLAWLSQKLRGILPRHRQGSGSQHGDRSPQLL
jgi:hypothetical protein